MIVIMLITVIQKLWQVFFQGYLNDHLLSLTTTLFSYLIRNIGWWAYSFPPLKI